MYLDHASFRYIHIEHPCLWMYFTILFNFSQIQCLSTSCVTKRCPGVYRDWHSCQEQVYSFSGCYRNYLTEHEAIGAFTTYIREHVSSFMLPDVSCEYSDDLVFRMVAPIIASAKTKNLLWVAIPVVINFGSSLPEHDIPRDWIWGKIEKNGELGWQNKYNEK